MRSMNGRGRWFSRIAAGLTLVGALAVAVAPVSAQGRKHALLVGVGDYIHIRDLEGPPHDVDSLQEVLHRDWAFDEITTLVNREATRPAILGALDDLIRDTRPGDYVFIYFSGHGTSSLDPDAPDLAAVMDPGTGALVPAEIDPRSPDAGDVLLIGRRDLRPRLLELDQDRDVLVVLDACHSGNTPRGSSIRPEEADAKYVEWPPGQRQSSGRRHALPMAALALPMATMDPIPIRISCTCRLRKRMRRHLISRNRGWRGSLRSTGVHMAF